MDSQTTISKFLCLLLRHHPELLELNMDNHGWVEVDELLQKLNQDRGARLYLSNLQFIVKSDDKQRYEMKQVNGKYFIRCQYGHNARLHIVPDHEETIPPKILYHGTATKSIDKIKKHGLLPMGREYVHLTENKNVAKSTGQRHGTPVILEVRAKEMSDNDIVFYKAPNGIWLTKYVEKEYIDGLT